MGGLDGESFRETSPTSDLTSGHFLWPSTHTHQSMWEEEQERVTAFTFSLKKKKKQKSLEWPFLLAPITVCLISPTGWHLLLAG